MIRIWGTPKENVKCLEFYSPPAESNVLNQVIQKTFWFNALFSRIPLLKWMILSKGHVWWIYDLIPKVWGCTSSWTEEILTSRGARSNVIMEIAQDHEPGYLDSSSPLSINFLCTQEISLSPSGPYLPHLFQIFVTGSAIHYTVSCPYYCIHSLIILLATLSIPIYWGPLCARSFARCWECSTLCLYEVHCPVGKTERVHN